MARPIPRGRSHWILALLVATSVSLLTLDFRGFGPLESVQSGLRDAVEPLASGVRSGTGPVRNLWHGIVDYDRIKEENDLLRDEVAQLRTRQVTEENAKAQLDEILALEGVASSADIETQLARVVSGPVNNFENTIRLDQGSNSGIVRNMVVVTDAGLVGRVESVTADRSVVALADSRDFGVGVRVISGGAQRSFLAIGQGPGRPLRMQGEVPVNVGIHDGAELVTSGLDQSLYPADIPVGRILGTGLTQDSATSTARSGIDVPALENVSVELFVNPRELSFVTVLLWEPEK